jgi:hypothetical protein
VIGNKEVPNIDMLHMLKAFPFFSKRIMLFLSWNKTLSWTWYPWASMKYQVQQIADMKLSAPTISNSRDSGIEFLLVQTHDGKSSSQR